MSLFSSLKSEAATVLLWGDRWWLPRHQLPVPFAEPAQAAALLAAAWPGRTKRLRIVYHPDDFATVPATCPNAGRTVLSLALAEEFPVVTHPGLVWSHEPILAAGESFNTLLHHETRPALFGLVHQLQEHGFTVDSVWPLPTWLNALPPDLSDSGAMTLVAVSAERFCLYRHSPEGVRSVQTGQGADVLDQLAGILQATFAKHPDEFVLYVTTDDSLIDALNQRLPLIGDRVVGHFSVWEALAKPAPISGRHPAQLLPPGAVLLPARALAAACALVLAAGLALGGEYLHREITARRTGAELAREVPALRAEIARRQQAQAELAALRAEAGRPAPVFGPWLRAVGQVPGAVTLTALRATRGEFTVTGGVTAAGALTEAAWRDWLGRLGGETWRVEPAGLPAGTVRLTGRPR
ncbi:MAG: hypothetical protein JNG82_11200 [Opitutaceae bacterium]|nr:hypothetical protein [Opitutaceae bacterium]